MKNLFYFFLLVGLGICSSPVANAQTINFQDTKGELTVDGSGSANYKIPIALPPGIKDVAPQIALAYNNSNKNGIAGYGWSIVGVSSIKRSPSSKNPDGYVDPIDFDDNDQFTLDGQRLIKLGNNTLGTENFSNMKIIVNGSYLSPESFTIYSPDGVKITYGASTSSKSPVEWLITKWVDTYGNTINYEYSNSNNVIYISKIIWGENEKKATNYINTIEFKYKNRERFESGYVTNHNVKSTTILDYISVYTNSNLFRKYQLSHITNELKYQIVDKITEYNSNNEAANPIVFTYDKTESKLIQKDYKFNNTTLDLGRLDLRLSGDYDGDGYLDVYSQGKLFLNLFNTNNTTPQIVDIQNTIPLSTTISKIKQNNKIIQANGFGAYQGIGQTTGSMSENPMLEDNYKLNISYRYYNGSSNFQEVASTTVSFPHLDKKMDQDRCFNQPGYDQFEGAPNIKMLDGDFNGDGISEVLILGQETHNVTRMQQPDPNILRKPPLGCDNVQFKYSTPTYYLDIYANEYLRTTLPLDYEQRIDIIDFNGDGKDDIIAVGTYGDVTVYTFDEISKSFYALNSNIPYTERQFKEYNTFYHPDYSNNSFNDVLIYGDYNGDGKIDALLPKGENNSSWSLYLSDGVRFYKQDIIIEPFIKNTTTSRTAQSFTYYPLDINGDGKSDLVKVFQMAYNEKGDWDNKNIDTSFQVYAYTNLNSNGDIRFDSSCYNSNQNSTSTCLKSLYYTSDVRGFGYPLVGKFKNANSFFDLLLIKTTNGGTLHTYTFTKDQEKDSRLISVQEAGGSIKHQLEYTKLDKKNTTVYKSEEAEFYPNIEVKHLPNSFVVSKLTYTAPNIHKYRLYQYRGLTINQQGLGILGFKRFAQSGWIVPNLNDGTKISPYWEVSQNDPSKRGVTISSWSFNSTNTNLIDSNSDENLIGKTNNTFNYTTFPDKRFILLPTTIIQKDFITGVTTTNENSYDQTYFNTVLNKETKSANGQTFVTTTTNILDNYPNSSNYIIGQLRNKTVKFDAYNSSYLTQEKYTYTAENNIAKTITTVQNDGEQIIDYTYDTFGNVIRIIDYGKKINSLVDPPSGGIGIAYLPREINNTYDSNGRFVIKKKDVEGYETHLEYNLLGQVTKETDKFGAITSTEYDKWGKLLKVTLSNSSTTPITTQYQYSRDTNGWNIISFSDQTKAYSAQYFDAVGNNIKNTIKGFSSGQYISSSTEYDFLGRKLRESQPYFNSPSQWRTYEYDHLLRPTKITNHTGLVVTNSYNGLTITTTEGVRSKKVTKDAVGNTVQLVDNGTETINYTYYPHGGVKTTTYGSHVITTNYDVWGRRTSLLDPSVSSTPYTYSYTVYDEIKEEKMPEGTTKYKYDGVGKILEKTTTGKSNISVKYTYDSSKKGLLIKEYGNNEGNSFSNDITYDNFYRIAGKNEVTPKFVFGKQFVYDEFGRVMNSESWTMTNNKRVQTVILNHQYNQYNGELNLLLDISKGVGKIVWKANAKNERGQLLNSTLGELIAVENTYDAYGNITNIRNKKGNDWLYNVDYQYQLDRGLLTKRTDSHFGWEENFTYDNFDRLLTWSSPNGTNSNTYLSDGRINKNSQVGEYSYLPNEKYKKKSIGLNPQGNTYYSTRKLQDITFDAFKRPLSISEEGRGLVNFQYGINGSRFYAKKQDLLANKTVQKYYSQDGTMDISVDQSGNTKIINYISSPYETPLIYVTELNSALTTIKEGFHYLARDFQGSITQIYDANANVIERRLFDPWGNIVKVQDKNGAITEGENAKLIFLDRGYTGHEHFAEVGIIHMNGRIYDPMLKQFLSPDNFIQDPNNSQSYNRYGYAWNNPLKFTDPSGEEFVSAMIVGAIIGAFFYTGNAMLNDNFSVFGLFKSALFGAIGGYASAGIGAIAGNISSSLVSSGMSTFLANTITTVAQAAMHGVSQGIIQGVAAGDFGSLGTTLISSAISSVASGIMKDYINPLVGRVDDLWKDSGFSTIMTGTISGGITSSLTGGNFWQGAHTGLIVSALNHASQHFRAKPKYEDVRKGYPTNSDGTDDMETSEVFKSVFGENYDTQTFKNACATRCSIGLNEAGEPVRKDFLGSVGKMKGKGIIASAVGLKNWMIKTYGNPDVQIANPSSFNEVSNAINGRRGIYIMEPRKGAFSSPLITGHATLWNGNDAIGGHNYISSAKMIYFWSLK